MRRIELLNLVSVDWRKYIMGTEIIIIIFASAISLITFVVTTWWNQRKLSIEFNVREKEWQEGFRAELRKELFRESTLKILEERLEYYSSVWEKLEITAGYRIRHSQNLKEEIQNLANFLTGISYGHIGLIMTDRSRRLLLYLREGCGSFLKDEIEISTVQDRAHLLKHSMRSDMGIEDYEYENEINKIARSLGRVDDWN
jgi:hypothetical protein